MLANIVLIAHFAVVLFITAGLPLIILGAVRRWRWVRKWRWRLLHLMATVVVALESMIGMACPLTVWEDRLRGFQPRAGFIERWIEHIMFFDLPPWTFIAAYTIYAAIVAAMWFAVPVSRDVAGAGPERAGIT